MVLLVLAAVSAFAYVHYRYGQIHKVNVDSLTALGASGQPQTILLVGSNSRAALDGKQTRAFGSAAEVGGARSDVTMLLHADPATHRISVLSIPRDLWLSVPGQPGYQERVDAALNQGPRRLVQTIQQDLGIPVNHYVELNFDSFQSVVQDLGGIDMYFPTPVKDAYSALKITRAGCQHLDGFQALAVVRARHLYYMSEGSWHYDGLGDLSRIRRDHEFMRVLFSAVSQRGLGNPFTANSVLGSLTPDLQVDSGFSLGDMVSLALTYHGVDAGSVPTQTLPVVVYPRTYYYRGSNLGDVVFPAEPLDRAVIDSFLGRSGTARTSSARAPSSTRVAVLNGSGLRDQATQVAAQLSNLGYTTTVEGEADVVGNPAETVVRYAPGHLDAARALLGRLSGEVAMAEGGTAPGSDLTVVTGTTVAVATPAEGATGQRQTAGGATTASTQARSVTEARSAARAGSATPASTQAQPVWSQATSPDETPAWYDPTGCPSPKPAAPAPGS